MRLLKKRRIDKGTEVHVEIEGEVTVRLVPNGFDRLLIPQTDGSPAVAIYL